MFRVLYRDLGHRIRTLKPSIIVQSSLFDYVFPNQNSLSRSISHVAESKNPNPPSFAVDYLIKSCGLPPKTALSVASKIRLRSTEKPDSVISLFQTHGFTKSQISKLISKHPSLLLSGPYKNLKPKLDFFYGLGISAQDLSEHIALHPTILDGSLDKQIIPTFNFLKTYLGTNADILMIFKRCPKVLKFSIENVLIPNISILRDHGVPSCNISKLLISSPSVLTLKPDRFKEIVESVKEMGFESSKLMFPRAVRMMACLSKSTLHRKLMIFGEFGFSENEVLSLIKKQPMCLCASEEKMRKVLKFFTEKLKRKQCDILLNPIVLTLSLEKRVIPRCGVLEILYWSGKMRMELHLDSILLLSEKAFYKKFVMEYQERDPEIMKAYKGETELVDYVKVVGAMELAHGLWRGYKKKTESGVEC